MYFCGIVKQIGPSLLIALLVFSACERISKVTQKERHNQSIDTVVLRDTIVIKDTLIRYSPIDWQSGFNLSHDPNKDSIWGEAVDYYISDPACDALAFDFYYGSFKPEDNASTAELLDLCLTSNVKLRPFYRWCLDKTIEVADGALAEYPGEPARKYAEKYPEEFFEFVDAPENKHSYYNWVDIIAYSGLYEYKYQNDKAYKAILSRMTNNCKDCSDELISRIEIFAKAVTHVDEEIDDGEETSEGINAEANQE